MTNLAKNAVTLLSMIAKDISVIVPVYNRAHLLERALRSLAEQTVRPAHVVIVDNGSSDASLRVAQRWAEKMKDVDEWQLTVVEEARRGACAARNRGLQEVATRYVSYLDSDDEFTPPHFERIASLLSGRSELQLVYYDKLIIDPEGWSTLKSVNDPLLLRGHLFHSSLTTTAYTVEAELLRRVGAWNEELPIWNDLELGVRLLLQQPKAMKLNGEPTVLVHPQVESITGTDFHSRAKDIERSLDTIDYHLSFASNHLWTMWVEARRATLAAHYHREGARDEAERLLAATLSRHQGRDRQRLQWIYQAVRLTGRGGAARATRFWAPPKEEIFTGKRPIFKR